MDTAVLASPSLFDAQKTHTAIICVGYAFQSVTNALCQIIRVGLLCVIDSSLLFVLWPAFWLAKLGIDFDG